MSRQGGRPERAGARASRSGAGLATSAPRPTRSATDATPTGCTTSPRLRQPRATSRWPSGYLRQFAALRCKQTRRPLPRLFRRPLLRAGRVNSPHIDPLAVGPHLHRSQLDQQQDRPHPADEVLDQRPRRRPVPQPGRKLPRNARSLSANTTSRSPGPARDMNAIIEADTLGIFAREGVELATRGRCPTTAARSRTRSACSATTTAAHALFGDDLHPLRQRATRAARRLRRAPLRTSAYTVLGAEQDHLAAHQCLTLTGTRRGRVRPGGGPAARSRQVAAAPRSPRWRSAT